MSSLPKDAMIKTARGKRACVGGEERGTRMDRVGRGVARTRDILFPAGAEKEKGRPWEKSGCRSSSEQKTKEKKTLGGKGKKSPHRMWKVNRESSKKFEKAYLQSGPQEKFGKEGSKRRDERKGIGGGNGKGENAGSWKNN